MELKATVRFEMYKKLILIYKANKNDFRISVNTIKDLSITAPNVRSEKLASIQIFLK